MVQNQIDMETHPSTRHKHQLLVLTAMDVIGIHVLE